MWIFLRHRDQYPPWRNVIAILTFGCLAIQLIPVAPPRLLPELGFVDTAHLYGQSVYGAVVGDRQLRPALGHAVRTRRLGRGHRLSPSCW